MKYRLGLDVGGTKVNLVLTDMDGMALDKRHMRVRAEAGAQAVMRDVAECARDMLRARDANAADIARVGMGVPGTTDGRMVLHAPNLHWQNEPCADYFNEAFGIAPLLIQDTRAAAWGEYVLGAAKGRAAVLCVTLGTGVGCGMVLGGKIYSGALGTAGEVGHIPVVPGGRACNCGRRGCMEAYASGTGIARSASEHPALGKRAHAAEDVFALAKSGDEDARALISDAVDKAAQAICAAVNLLSPDALIFSGGMCAQTELYVNPLIARVRETAYALAVDDRLLIAVSALGADAPALGAAML